MTLGEPPRSANVDLSAVNQSKSDIFSGQIFGAQWEGVGVDLPLFTFDSFPNSVFHGFTQHVLTHEFYVENQ